LPIHCTTWSNPHSSLLSSLPLIRDLAQMLYLIIRKSVSAKITIFTLCSTIKSKRNETLLPAFEYQSPLVWAFGGFGAGFLWLLPICWIRPRRDLFRWECCRSAIY